MGAGEAFSKDRVEETKAEPVYTRRRKRGQEKTDSKNASPVQDDVILQNDDEDSLESGLHLFCLETYWATKEGHTISIFMENVDWGVWCLITGL